MQFFNKIDLVIAFVGCFVIRLVITSVAGPIACFVAGFVIRIFKVIISIHCAVYIACFDFCIICIFCHNIASFFYQILFLLIL